MKTTVAMSHQRQDRRRAKAAVAQKQLVGLLGLSTVVVGLLIVLNRFEWLPDRFLYDASLIQAGAQGHARSRLGESYGVVADIYRLLGLADRPILAGVVGFGLALLVLRWMLRRVGTSFLRPQPLALLGLYILLSSVFLGTYSKDVFVLLVLAPVLMANTPQRAERWLLFGVLWYAMFFRSYWFIVASLYLLIRYAYSRRQRLSTIVASMWSGIIIVSLALYFIQSVNPDHYRNVVNVGRTSTNTLIEPVLISPQPLAGLINNLIVSLFLVIPFPLFTIATSYHLLLGAGITVIWALFYWHIKVLERSNPSGIEGMDKQLVILVFAFLGTQSIFEPDYGSALRHLTPMLLLHLWLSIKASGLGSPGTSTLRGSKALKHGSSVK